MLAASDSATFPVEPIPPRHSTWPYTDTDFKRQDKSADSGFYSSPRFETHIDDTAISQLRKYYDQNLPTKGRILDFCSSWLSHYPAPVEDAAKKGDLIVVGHGMNKAELDANEVLTDAEGGKILRDLNQKPKLPSRIARIGGGPEGLDAATCVVSIDYLTDPVSVLKSLWDLMKPGAKVHLAISNRCFPTKIITRWLQVDERERLKMVGDFLHFAGWKEVEIVDLNKTEDSQPGGRRPSAFMVRMRSMGKAGNDPIWIVRATKEE
ncbi:MAG: hypothetical protein M1820_004072 [Bogoriella megaspora]|nr:MAG: hypothetical protein M1820_004072 [Bogoriella megaspora]